MNSCLVTCRMYDVAYVGNDNWFEYEKYKKNRVFLKEFWRQFSVSISN